MVEMLFSNAAASHPGHPPSTPNSPLSEDDILERLNNVLMIVAVHFRDSLRVMKDVSREDRLAGDRV